MINDHILENMLKQEQVEKQLKSVKREFWSQIPIWCNEAIDKLAIKIIPKQQLDQVRQDMGIETETKLQFLSALPEAFLKKITKYETPPDEVKTVQQLLIFAQSFFKEHLPVVKKTPLLRDIIREMNQKIQVHFRERKLNILELIQQEKVLQQQAIKQDATPQHVYTFIRRDREDRIKKQETIKKQEMQKNEDGTAAVVSDALRERFPHCLCTKSVLNVTDFLQTVNCPIVKCRVCDNSFHTTCLKIQSERWLAQFMCPGCIILRLDPLHKIVDVLSAPVPFRPTQHAPTKTLTFVMLGKDPAKQVEVRCLKLDGMMGAEEPTWPDVGELLINGTKVADFKPLQTHSSLKKRKDEKYTTREVRYCASNTIQLREAAPTSDQKLNCRYQLGQVYYLGVFAIQALLPQQLIDEVLGTQQNWMCVRDCKEAIQLYMGRFTATDIHVDRLSVNLTCFFDTRLIGTPVRGNLCEHIQCFSLENTIQMMDKSTPRKWRCPICKSKCFEFVIDAYQLLILKLIKVKQLKFEECSFTKYGVIEQEEIKNLINHITTKAYLPYYGIKNENKFAQLESLRCKIQQNLEKIDQVRWPKPEIQIHEPIKTKQVCPTNNSITTKNSVTTTNKKDAPSLSSQYLNQAHSILQKMIQSYSEVKGCGDGITPIFID